jgi:DNA-binding response OmpR family regulator
MLIFYIYKVFKTVKKILCVDDSQVVVKFIKMYLEKKDIDVISITDVSEVSKFAKNKDIDLYIIDYVMPGMKGDELARSILKCHPGAKIVVYSVMSDSVLKKSFDGIPIKGFVEKNFNTVDFAKKIESLIDD